MNHWQRQRAFTLIELIVVLIIIGVMAVSLLPRFFSAAGTSEYLYRDQALSILRLAQVQAMQCTNTVLCPVAELTVAADRLGSTASCLNNASHLCIDSKDAVTLVSPVTQLQFNSLGKALQCAGGCQMAIVGAVSLAICIESEGYIRPCAS